MVHIDLDCYDFELTSKKEFTTKTGYDYDLYINGEHYTKYFKINDIVWDMSDYDDVKNDRGSLFAEGEIKEQPEKKENPKQKLDIYLRGMRIESNNTPIGTKVYTKDNVDITSGLVELKLYAGDAETVSEVEFLYC